MGQNGPGAVSAGGLASGSQMIIAAAVVGPNSLAAGRGGAGYCGR